MDTVHCGPQAIIHAHYPPNITLYCNTQSLRSVIQTKLSAAVAIRSALAFLPSAISPSRSHLWHRATIKQASTSIMGRHTAASLWGRKQIKQFYSFMLHPIMVSSEHSQAHTSQIFPYISMFNFVTFDHSPPSAPMMNLTSALPLYLLNAK